MGTTQKNGCKAIELGAQSYKFVPIAAWLETMIVDEPEQVLTSATELTQLDQEVSDPLIMEVVYSC